MENTTIEETDRLYYAVIDMDSNGGLGKVVSKKNVAYKGILPTTASPPAAMPTAGTGGWCIRAMQIMSISSTS